MFFLSNICIRDFSFFFFPNPFSCLKFFLAFTKRGSGSLSAPIQNPRPSLLMNLLRYEQSLKIISFCQYFLSYTASQSLKSVYSQSPLKSYTFLRKLYLQSHSKVICPCQNILNSALEILSTSRLVFARNQQLGLELKF